VFRGTTVATFRNHVQQAQDILLKGVTDPEQIFDHLQLKYEELLMADRWVSMKKKTSAFVLGEPANKTYVEDEKAKTGKTSGKEPAKKPNNLELVKDANGKQRRVKDAKGNTIDYTPPKEGKPQERKKGDFTEYWCAKCQRWGNHKTVKHDEFYADLEAKKAERNQTRASANFVTPSVSFAQATSGNLNLVADPELMDGIDL
jgi:hypothetical protein